MASTLGFGEPAPTFVAHAIGGNANYHFDTVAGRPVLLLFFAGAGSGDGRAGLRAVAEHRALFDDSNAVFFGVTSDPEDWRQNRVALSLPGIRFLADPDRKIHDIMGIAGTGWVLLDRQLRIAGRWAVADHAVALARLAALGRADGAAEGDFAPILFLPRVFEPDFCRDLIDHFEKRASRDSGFMRDVDGKTVEVIDHTHKRRSDVMIEDTRLIADIHHRIARRLLPAIARAFQYRANRMERHLVARYDAESGGHFRPHRDNTTRGTAHRRFAVTINLNAGDYDGGDLRFPEFGMRTYRAATGGAVIFSCSLLHEAMPVVRGNRYAFLPFLYDDDAAELRAANNSFLGENVAPYRNASTN